MARRRHGTQCINKHNFIVWRIDNSIRYNLYFILYRHQNFESRLCPGWQVNEYSRVHHDISMVQMCFFSNFIPHVSFSSCPSSNSRHSCVGEPCDGTRRIRVMSYICRGPVRVCFCIIGAECRFWPRDPSQESTLFVLSTMPNCGVHNMNVQEAQKINL